MTKTTNTNGIITAASESKAPVNTNYKMSPSTIMNNILNAEATKKLLQNSLKENAGAFSASVIDLFNSDTNLQKCDPKQVFAECLKAVSLKLPISKQLGFAYIVPYDKLNPKPQFQIGYKGMIQLCMRTGEYRYINADVVYEGEYVSSDKLTGSVDLSGEKVSDKVIGYFAYIETLNSFKKTLYWTREKVEEHARRYSKSFTWSNSAWATNFDEMAIKTVLRNLISKYGIMSIEIANALQAEEAPAPLPEHQTAEEDTDKDVIDVTPKENTEDENVIHIETIE